MHSKSFSRSLSSRQSNGHRKKISTCFPSSLHTPWHF